MKNQKFQKLIKFILPVIIWAGVIFTFSSLKTAPVSKVYWREFVFKKSAHLFVYGVLSTLLYRAFVNYKRPKLKSGYLAILLCFFYGISDEFHQSFTPGREPTVRDVIIDTIGAYIAIYLIWRCLPPHQISKNKILSLVSDFIYGTKNKER